MAIEIEVGLRWLRSFGNWFFVAACLLLIILLLLPDRFDGASPPSGGSVPGRTPASRLNLATGTDSAVSLASGYCSSPSSAKARTLITDHPEWDIVDVAQILCGKVAVGMTSAQVRLSLGFPSAIRRTNVFGSTESEWWYGARGVAFENGFVTTLLIDSDIVQPSPDSVGAVKPDSIGLQLTRAVARCHEAARDTLKPRGTVKFIDNPELREDLGNGKSHVRVELQVSDRGSVPTSTMVDCNTREAAARLELTEFDSWQDPDP